MTAHPRKAALALGLLLFASSALAAGRTLPLDTSPALSARAAGTLGRFPRIEAVEPAVPEQASLIPVATIDPSALFVPPGHVAAVITSVTSGNWNSGATWSGGVVPTAADDVVIADGTTVTINAAAACATLLVGQGVSGLLQYEPTTARTLSVGGNVTIAANGTFQSAASGSITTHALLVGGSLTNHGTLDFSTNANAAGANLTFTGASSATFGGTGGTTDIRTITVNKGSSVASVLELSPASFTVRGSATNVAPAAGMLAITNGTFKLAGTFAGSNTLGTVAGWSVPATGGLWLANPNYTVVAQNGTVTINGSLVMDAGTFNVGTSAGNRLATVLGSSVTVNGGAINVSGRFSPTSNGVAYTQTGGTMTVTTVDNASTTNAGFDITGSSTFAMSGGTIVVQRAASVGAGPRDYRNFAASVNITGGTLQLGNGSSPGGQTFTIQGSAPGVSVTALGGNHTAVLGADLEAYGTTTVAVNAKLTLNGFRYVERGPAIVNSGTIDGGAAGSSLYFAGTSPQTYFQAGVNGTASSPLAALEVDNQSTLAFNAAATTTIVSRVNLFTGGIVNANKLQLGAGGTSGATTQIGTAGNTTTGGTYDVSPAFSIGSGGYTLLYQPETDARTTGAEIPPSRAIQALTVNNLHDVALADGDLAVGTLSFPANSLNLTTGENTVAIDAGGSVVRSDATTSGWVAGNLRKDAPAGNSSRTFEIGSANYAPVAVDLAGVAAPGTLTARSDDGDLPVGSGIDASKSVNRNWTLTGSPGLSLASATGTFTFPASDVDGGANPSNFVVRKLDGSTWSPTTTGTRTGTSTQATWNSGFSSFAIGELERFAVNTSVIGSGSVTKNPDQPLYDVGSDVQLTATPAPGWHFVGWSGDAGGDSSVVSVTVDGTKNVTATFAPDQFALNVTIVGNGAVTKTPDQPLYDFGTEVGLSAQADSGWHFAGWSGDATGETNVATVTMDGTKDVTATFEPDAPPQFALNVTIVGNGTVTKEPDQALYDAGTQVGLSAQADSGWHFIGWSGDASGENVAVVTMDTTKNVTATFEADPVTPQYALNLTIVGNGTVTKTPDQALYDLGTEVGLSAQADSGWHFVGWSGDASGETNVATVTMNGTKNVTVTFEPDAPPQFALNVTIVGNGTVTKEPDQALYDAGTQVGLTAYPDSGWHFVGWSGDASGGGENNVAVVTMDTTKNVTATFEADPVTPQYALNIAIVGNGTVTKTPDQALYDVGTEVGLSAQADSGWHFVGWSGDASSGTNVAVVTMDTTKNVTATFESDAPPQFALNVTIIGNGTVTKEPDLALYDAGTQVGLTAYPDSGWHFVGYSGDATSSGETNVAVVTMDTTKNVTATFEADPVTPQYALNITVVGNGTVTRTPDQPLYDAGTMVQLQALPDSGWHVAGWSGDTSSDTDIAVVTMDTTKSVTAIFESDAPPQYALNVTILGNGTVTKEPDQALYDAGTQVGLTAYPDSGWHFVGWSGDASSGTNVAVVTMDTNKNVTATFEADAPPQFALNVTIVGNGTVTKTPDQALYDAGTQVGLDATADPGWHFVGWSGDASSETNVAVVTMDGTKKVTATFEEDPVVGVETAILRFALLPIVPSPSVGNARLRYELPQDADVNLSIVDVKGREVARLVHGTVPAGRHLATWNGQTPQGRAPAGVYFARCVTAGARVMQRIVLLR